VVFSFQPFFWERLQLKVARNAPIRLSNPICLSVRICNSRTAERILWSLILVSFTRTSFGRHQTRIRHYMPNYMRFCAPEVIGWGISTRRYPEWGIHSRRHRPKGETHTKAQRLLRYAYIS
jgi:hypothetical protein